MRRCQDEAALTDLVALVAEDLGALRRVVGNLFVVLLVLGVAEEDSALDLLLDSVVQLTQGASDDGSTLAVEFVRKESLAPCDLVGADLYPPVTTEASGHFSWAMLYRRMASSMASWLVPLGRRLSPVVAS